MYFENRIESIEEAKTPEQIVELLDNWKNASYRREDGDLIIFVDDGHIDSPFSEVAVVNQTKEIQIESLTWAWIKTEEEKLEHVKNCLTTNHVFRRNITAPLDYQVEKDKLKFFTCTCCGNGFKCKMSKQLPYDQDNGYGVCPGCEKYF